MLYITRGLRPHGAVQPINSKHKQYRCKLVLAPWVWVLFLAEMLICNMMDCARELDEQLLSQGGWLKGTSLLSILVEGLLWVYCLLVFQGGMSLTTAQLCDWTCPKLMVSVGCLCLTCTRLA